jgi:hypothetical protein
MSQNQFGQLKQLDFIDNTGGINLVDSVFKSKDSQAAGGINFDYVLTGGVRKRLGAPKINSVADTALYTLGFGLRAPTSGLSKAVFRAADRKFQLFDTSTPSFTALTQDTAAAGSNAFALNSIQDVQFVQFSTGSSDILWGAGGGAALPVGAYSTTKFTANGVGVPTGSFSGVVNAHNSGSWTAAGSYSYALVWRKASTQALSNATLDITKTTANTDDTVTLTIPPPSDVTLYDQVWIYRSARSGVSGFTTGNLIAQLASSSTSFVDKGDLGNPDILTGENIPRSASVVLDNSVLPSGTYNTLALWGHRLVTSSGNSLYISDVNKSESWPLTNYITVPSAGPITALATISFTSPQANSLQELLVIFKERELWVLTPGSESDYTTWTLMKVDNNVGCPQQSLVVTAQGFLAWIDYRGIWLWDGTSKPIYCSRTIEPLFGTGGDLDKSKFNEACGAFFRRENQIVWFLSSKTYGEQKFAIKMDVRLTLLQIEQSMTGRTIDAVLMQDVHTNPIYSAMAYVPLNGQDEQLVMGDSSGFCYFASNGYSDGGSAISFRYLTPPLHCGNPNIDKEFHAVIVWVQDIGDWNLYLDYWSDYQTANDKKTTIGLPISTESQNASLWDIATYDFSYWDSYDPNVIPIIYNLQPGTSNSAQGGALQLQFRNDNANEPITIHGFSVLYQELGGKSQ